MSVRKSIICTCPSGFVSSLLLFLVSCTNSIGQTVAKSDSLFNNKESLFSDKTATERWLVRNSIPAVGIGYVDKGKLEVANVYGVLETGRPATDDAIFSVASLTKPIAALVVLKLVNAGKWNLNTPISQYWTDPDLVGDPRLKKLTTRFILSHRSGFPNWRSGKLSFQYEPGTNYQYSGEGFEYLRKAIEIKFTKSFDQLAEELLFKPLQMNDTQFFWGDGIDEERFAKPHDQDGNLYHDRSIENKIPSAAFGVLTTVKDYSKFLIYVMNGAGLSKKLYNEMIADQTFIKANQYFGLGWIIDHIENEHVISHGGVGKGTQTIFFILPKSKKILLILTNSGNGGQAYISVMKKYLGKQGQEIIDVETK